MALRKLKSKHHQLALMVTAGKSPEEIGQALGMHANSVNRLRRDPMIQARIEEVRQEVQALVVADLAERIDLLAPKALDRVEDLLDTGPPGIRCRADPHRPYRYEPRVRKRRPKPYPLMTKPRP